MIVKFMRQGQTRDTDLEIYKSDDVSPNRVRRIRRWHTAMHTAAVNYFSTRSTLEKASIKSSHDFRLKLEQRLP